LYGNFIKGGWVDALLIVRTRINDTRVALARQHHIPIVAYGRTETSEPYLLHMPDEQIFGAVEAGGTKFICAVGRGVHEMLEERRIATRQPAETLAEVRQFFHAMQLEYGRMRGFGIASFGPIQLDRRAHDWGRMLATPKPGWANANLITALQPVADCAIGLDTDVNAAALAEAQLVPARDAAASRTSPSAPASVPASPSTTRRCAGACIRRWGTSTWRTACCCRTSAIRRAS
jgi:hypothetical protein